MTSFPQNHGDRECVLYFTNTEFHDGRNEDEDDDDDDEMFPQVFLRSSCSHACEGTYVNPSSTSTFVPNPLEQHEPHRPDDDDDDDGKKQSWHDGCDDSGSDPANEVIEFCEVEEEEEDDDEDDDDDQSVVLDESMNFKDVSQSRNVFSSCLVAMETSGASTEECGGETGSCCAGFRCFRRAAIEGDGKTSKRFASAAYCFIVCFKVVVGFLSSRLYRFMGYAILVLAILSSLVSLLLVGVMVVHPYTLVASYHKTTCQTVAITDRIHPSLHPSNHFKSDPRSIFSYVTLNDPNNPMSLSSSLPTSSSSPSSSSSLSPYMTTISGMFPSKEMEKQSVSPHSNLLTAPSGASISSSSSSSSSSSPSASSSSSSLSSSSSSSSLLEAADLFSMLTSHESRSKEPIAITMTTINHSKTTTFSTNMSPQHSTLTFTPHKSFSFDGLSSSPPTSSSSSSTSSSSSAAAAAAAAPAAEVEVEALPLSSSALKSLSSTKSTSPSKTSSSSSRKQTTDLFYKLEETPSPISPTSSPSSSSSPPSSSPSSSTISSSSSSSSSTTTSPAPTSSSAIVLEQSVISPLFQEHSCSCGKGCNSRFKCFKIYVRYLLTFRSPNSSDHHHGVSQPSPALIFNSSSSLERNLTGKPEHVTDDVFGYGMLHEDETMIHRQVGQVVVQVYKQF